jgi:predicted RNase H-like nuclease (RuvC/YqgF family)
MAWVNGQYYKTKLELQEEAYLRSEAFAKDHPDLKPKRKRQPTPDSAFPEKAAMKNRIAELSRKAAGLEDEVAQLKRQIMYLQIERSILRDEQSGAKASAVPKEMLGRLIRLCHPDRHDGSAAATEATQWLLKQRT